MSDIIIMTPDEYFEQSGDIFLRGSIDDKTYLAVAKQIRYLTYLKKNSIRIFLNSEGGELESALGIIDEFAFAEKRGCDIYTIAVGRAFSSAAIILAYGTKRFATENTSMMLHPITYNLGENEHQSTKTYVDFAEDMYNTVMTQLAQRCGRKSPAKINGFLRDIRNGKWFDTDEAIKFGLIDGKWDYS
jgi:ATP-dependent protease ClpP protease subunit